jgi:hypothetical protein
VEGGGGLSENGWYDEVVPEVNLHNTNIEKVSNLCGEQASSPAPALHNESMLQGPLLGNPLFMRDSKLQNKQHPPQPRKESHPFRPP